MSVIAVILSLMLCMVCVVTAQGPPTDPVCVPDIIVVSKVQISRHFDTVVVDPCANDGGIDVDAAFMTLFQQANLPTSCNASLVPASTECNVRERSGRGRSRMMGTWIEVCFQVRFECDPSDSEIMAFIIERADAIRSVIRDESNIPDMFNGDSVRIDGRGRRGTGGRGTGGRGRRQPTGGPRGPGGTGGMRRLQGLLGSCNGVDFTMIGNFDQTCDCA